MTRAWQFSEAMGTAYPNSCCIDWQDLANALGYRCPDKKGSTMKSRMTIAVLTVAFAVSQPCAPANAQTLDGTLKKVKESGTITLGYRESSIPFSYLDDNQKPVGYSMDLCGAIVDEVKRELKMPNLVVSLQPVTSATRIPLMANGTIDLECGSTTNNLEREKQVAFALTTFVTANRLVAKKTSHIIKLDDMKGKTIVSTSGTSNIKQIVELNAQRNLGMNVIAAKDHAEAFLMVGTDRAVAFAMDDILLYSLVATDPNPADYYITAEALSTEPYGIMLRRDDPAFKTVVDNAIGRLMKSGDIDKIYSKWFLAPIPPKNINLNVQMSAILKKIIASPTDSGDPAAYH
jgi:glutamate/aspartate transport system substrate-binding protein